MTIYNNVFKIMYFFRFVKIKDIFVKFVRGTQYYSHLMKMLMNVISAKMFITTNVGKHEISVLNVKELKLDVKLKNIFE